MAYDVAILRCKHCGAPLGADAVRTGDRIVTCEYCGTSQERIDAEAYMNDVETRIKAWISRSLPMGYTVGGSASVDPVARHSIFAKDVGPRISMELMTYRMNLMTLLGNRLLVMPFRNIRICQVSAKSTEAFEFNAKVKTISDLAVTDDDIGLVNEAECISECYALAVNNIDLLGEQKDGRWGIMARNFKEAADAIGREKGFANPARRLSALAKVCEGYQKMFSGDPGSGHGLVKEGNEELAKVRSDVMDDAQFCMMYNALDQEVNISGIVMDLLDHANSTGGDCVRTLDVIRNVMDAPLSIDDPGWRFMLQDLHRYIEIFQNISDAVLADDGGGIPIAQGDGTILFPFWEVELRYTFVTGRLWAKRSVEVTENLFVSAQFVCDPGCVKHPKDAVTDVFKNRPETRFLDSIKGRETTISGGCELAGLQGSIVTGKPAGRRIMLPLTRRVEAEKLCSEYLRQATDSDGKLRLSAPVVKRLVYIPCNAEGRDFILPAGFGNLVPAHIKRMNAEETMTI